MNATHLDPGKPLPIRRSDLVLWSTGQSGAHLVRNRMTGETFQLGQEERFLLEQLDGRQDAAQLAAAFAARFGEPLADDDLAEFLDLAARRGLLAPQTDGRAERRPEPDAGKHSGSTPLEPPNSRSHAALADFDGSSRSPKTWAAPGQRFDGRNPVLNGSLPVSRSAISRLVRCMVGRPIAAAAVFLEWLGKRLRNVGRAIHMFHLTHLRFTPRADDIFIVTYPRSGTTWMQMILYQLTTDGSMDIPHIAEYCPWFEGSMRSARGFETRPPPRIFKCHLPYGAIPKGPCKYLYVARDGRDVAVSYYYLYRTHVGYQKSFNEFFEWFMRGKVQYGSWFRHVRGWWRHRHDPNVLFLTYEELVRDLEGCIRKIIAFCRLNVPAERLPGIVERCSFTFMKQHESKFEPAFELLWEEGVQLNTFLRKGRIGDGVQTLTTDQEARFDTAFHRHFDGTELSWPAKPASAT